MGKTIHQIIGKSVKFNNIIPTVYVQKPYNPTRNYQNVLGPVFLLGDMCKRKCDIKHLLNKEKRQACKLQCDIQDLSNPKYSPYLGQLPGLGGAGQSDGGMGGTKPPSDQPEDSNTGKIILYSAIGLALAVGIGFGIRAMVKKNQ